MDNWFFKKVTDYWDMDVGAIDKYSLIFRNQYGEDERREATKSIVNAIEKHVAFLNDEQLIRAAIAMVNYLYRAANYTPIWDEAISLYLHASADTFTGLLRKRGYLLHYIADNIFKSTWEDFQRPVIIFPDWFRSAGIIYVCPQSVAWSLMKHDKIDEKDYFANLSRYIAEAQYVSEGIIKKCHATNAHYVFQNTDDRDSKQVYKCSMDDSKSPGVISIIRNEPPVKDSNVRVIYPKDKLQAGA